MPPYLSSHNRHFLAKLRTEFPYSGAPEVFAHNLLGDMGVLPSYRTGAINRLVTEGWVRRTYGLLTRVNLTQQAMAALPKARKCGHTLCERWFTASDDLDTQRYCRPQCSNAAYRMRKEARDAAAIRSHPVGKILADLYTAPTKTVIREYQLNNQTETNKENPMPNCDGPLDRAELAIKVMRDETCATNEQQDKFIGEILTCVRLWNDAITANRDVAIIARRIARPDQKAELETLLVKHGFVAQPKPVSITHMSIVVEMKDGEPISAIRVLDMLRKHGVDGRGVRDCKYHQSQVVEVPHDSSWNERWGGSTGEFNFAGKKG